MDTVQFSGERSFVPHLAEIPAAWAQYTIADVDFTGHENVKAALLLYLASFKYESCDSLFLYDSDAAFRFFVGLYKEIASRVSLENYRFIRWLDFTAEIKMLGMRGDYTAVAAMADVKFLFIFDVTVHSKDEMHCLEKIIEYTYNNKVVTFACTRMDASHIEEFLIDDIRALVARKFLRIKIP